MLQDYEKPLLDPKCHLISKRSVRTIFHRVRDILECHTMFHIELSEAVRVWDAEERIGSIFTASVNRLRLGFSYQDFGIIWDYSAIHRQNVNVVQCNITFLGRLPKVDLIILEGEKCPSVRPYVRTSVRPSVHKKFVRFQ